MSSITATRRGFLYQDRVAVAIYLEELQKNQVEEFFVDFPLTGSQKSLDIRLIDKQRLEKIYEVKSGEEFIKDKRKRESSEVRDAFINLKEYSDKVSAAKLTLVIRSGFRGKISTYWDNIVQVRTGTLTHPQTKKSASWLLSKLRFPGIRTHEEMYYFCQKIELSDREDDVPLSTIDTFSDIDDRVLSMIEDLGKLVGSTANVLEYPGAILMKDLYHICAIAGGQNLHPLFKDKVIEFFGHRKFLDAHYTPPTDKDKKRSECVKEIDGKVNDFLNSPRADDLDPTPNTIEGLEYEEI